METSENSSSVEYSDSGSSGRSDSSYDPDKDRKLAQKKYNACRRKGNMRTEVEKKLKKASNARRSKDSIHKSNVRTNANRSKNSIRNSNTKREC